MTRLALGRAVVEIICTTYRKVMLYANEINLRRIADPEVSCLSSWSPEGSELMRRHEMPEFGVVQRIPGFFPAGMGD